MKFQELFGDAKFVTAEETSVNLQMRGAFVLKDTSEKTEIVICGLGYFDLKVNGKRVTDALFLPATSHYHHYDKCACYTLYGEEMSSRIYCVKYDITDFVVKGKNILVPATSSLLLEGVTDSSGNLLTSVELSPDKKYAAILISKETVTGSVTGIKYAEKNRTILGQITRMVGNGLAMMIPSGSLPLRWRLRKVII